MTKAEQLSKAIEAALSAVEPRRARCWSLCHKFEAEGMAAPVGSIEALTAQFASYFFAAEAVNAEAQAACRCYIAFADIFNGEIQEKSARLNPIRAAIRAAGYSTEYGSDPTSIVYRSGKRHVYAGFTVGERKRGDGFWRNLILNGEHLWKELQRLEKSASGKCTAEIISDAEAAAVAWQMLEKQREAYEENIHILRTQMLAPVTFDDWDRWRVSAY